ncbi:MAG: immunoglobulin domain-containing protein, partial [Phycisphaeraceae bacterium]|nr:immunoglobulin domain-containing protein [Phycisphaeraceae bacterium]
MKTNSLSLRLSRSMFAACLLLLAVPAMGQPSCVTWVLKNPGSSGPSSGYPSGVYAPFMWYDTGRQRVQLAGGIGLGEGLASVWEWDGTTWTNRCGFNRPVAFGPDSSVAFDEQRRVAMFFGPDGFIELADNGGITTRAYPGQLGRVGGRIAYSSYLRTIALASGLDADGLLITSFRQWTGSFWLDAYNGQFSMGRIGNVLLWSPWHSWVSIGGMGSGGTFGGNVVMPGAAPMTNQNPQPNFETGHAAAVDTARNAIVTFGGEGFGSNNGETWEYGASGWVRRATTGPSPRSMPGMAFDRARGVMVLFGGWDATGPRNDTWELTVTNGPQVTEAPQDQTVLYRHPVAFSVSATSAAVLTYQWKKNGNAIPLGTGPAHTIDSVSPTDSGIYSVEI